LSARPVYAVLANGALSLYTNNNRNSLIKTTKLLNIGPILEPVNSKLIIKRFH
jgi:hypothetical protein